MMRWLSTRQRESQRRAPASLFTQERTQEEVRRLLAAVSETFGYPTRLIVHLLYACGLRVTEPLNLRIKDVDFKESKLYVYQAKGGKGRVVLFPGCLTAALQKQMDLAKRVAEQDAYSDAFQTVIRF